MFTCAVHIYIVNVYMHVICCAVHIWLMFICVCICCFNVMMVYIDHYVLLGAEEGLFSLQTNTAQDPVMEQVKLSQLLR